MRMSYLRQDLRYGLRKLAREPLLSGITILVLALGIGASTAIFSAVNAVLLRPLPYPEPDRLVAVWESARSVDDDQIPVAPADFFDWQQQSRRFERLAAYHPWNFNLSGNGDPEQVTGGVATAELFDVLGTRPVLGRTFRRDECRQGGPAVVVLSDRFWRRRFGGDPRVLGQALRLDDVPFTIIGVMPPGFEFPRAAQLWKPFQSENYFSRDFQFLRVVGRLRPDASVASARREMATIAARLERSYPNSNSGREVTLLPLHEQTVGKVRPQLRVLAGAVLLMLLTACFNVANLLVARGLTRRPELALRQVMGAGTSRLLRQLLTENLVLALAGGVAGLLIAYAGVRFLVGFGPASVPRLDQTALDGRTLAFAAALTLVTAVLFGLAPAIQSSRLDLQGAIRTARGSARLRALHVLVGLQIAVALTLLVGASLLGRSFLRLAGVSPGFDPANLLTLSVSLPEEKYDTARSIAFYDEVQERIRNLPGVVAAGATLAVPVAEGMNIDTNFTVAGQPAPPPGQEDKAYLRAVSPGYFETLRIPLRAGRLLRAADRIDSPGVVLVNETLARAYLRGGNGGSPVGQRISFGAELGGLGNLTETPREIVGVVGDVRHEGLANDPVPEIYVANTQGYWRSMILVIRSTAEPASLTRPILGEIWKIDRNLPVAKIRTMGEILSDSVAQPRFYALLLAIFAGFALLLAAVGVYGVVSYSVALRTHEIGIRMALGARREDVFRMVLSRGLGLAAAGMLAGLLLAIGLGRFLRSLLFGVGATDPLTFASVVLVLGGVALLSTYLPARRAVAADPVTALRGE
jgi:putative ABC transport system permease protein